MDGNKLKEQVSLQYEMGKYSGTGDKDDLDNHSRQLNPDDEKYEGSDDDEG